MNRIRLPYFVLSILIGAVALSGCPPKKKLEVDDQSSTQEAEQAPEEQAEAPKEEGIQISQDWMDIPSLGMVNFAYDSAKIEGVQRDILKKNIAILRKLPPSVVVRVAGHCDDRGTIEYNIALGQRRANAVRNFYKTAGIAANRLQTISYGEERPLCTAHTDSCWERNRRAETQVRSPEPVTIDSSEL